MENENRLILASASPVRQQILAKAGLQFDVIVSGLDEQVIKSTFLQQGNPQDLALVLAQAKASVVSDRAPGKIVIGADQTLLFENDVLDKPTSVIEARERLFRLRNSTHSLETAVSIYKDGENLWSLSETNYLQMRKFSPEFLGRYMAHEGEAVCETVGGYRLEGLGIQLFSKIRGDYFSILGMPVLPVLSFLRATGAIDS